MPTAAEPAARIDRTMTPDVLPTLHAAVLTWYGTHARPLPWRVPDCSPWGVLVSEVMLQQTPVARVAGPWQEWLTRWPTPAALAQSTPADVLAAWGRLGYPRRALRLREAAHVIVRDHGGVVPANVDGLLALPGVGAYTASAVAAFAYHQRTVVLDTNCRRVLARLIGGEVFPPPSLTALERRRAEAALPADAATSVTWNVAVMELGALVCTASSPRCTECPVSGACAWLAAGRPGDAHAGRRRTQPWTGTDRQARGVIMAALREAPVPGASLADLWPDPVQRQRAVNSLVADGLAERVGNPGRDVLRLPTGAP